MRRRCNLRTLLSFAVETPRKGCFRKRPWAKPEEDIFSKAFKRNYGVPPVRWLRKGRKMPMTTE
jgi:AraC-like DNA-binding protein